MHRWRAFDWSRDPMRSERRVTRAHHVRSVFCESFDASDTRELSVGVASTE